MSTINNRNKPKLAFIFASERALWEWCTWNDGLYAAIVKLSDKFHIRVFGYCKDSALLESSNFDIQLVDNISSLQYWLRSFGTKLVYAVGPSTHPWAEMSRVETTNYLIHEGDKYSKKATSIFKGFVVKSISEAQHFPNSIVAFGTNTELFKDLSLNRIFPSFYPYTTAEQSNIQLWTNSLPAGSIASGEHTDDIETKVVISGHLLLPNIKPKPLSHLYNQAAGVCLTSSDSDITIARSLEAMACNAPVLVTQNSRATELDGVWSCPPESKQVKEAYFSMIMSYANSDVNLREEYVMGKYDEYTYAKALEELL